MILDPARRPLKVALKKDLRRKLKQGHPWIFRDALGVATAELADGAVVLVVGRDGRPIGRGFYAEHGPIAVRMLTTAAADELGRLLDERLGAALARRLELVRERDTDAFRWVHGEADRLPGLHVDRYGGSLSVLFDGTGARTFYLGAGLVERLVALAQPVAVKGVVARAARGEAASVLFGEPETELEVVENGLRFGVDLLHGQKGGLFLDQRENRARVRALASGRRVLNLFGYSGGFSLYAAAGGAERTITVDVAAPAIAAAQRNFAMNAHLLGERAGRDELVVADAFDFLEAARRDARRFELVVSDPPSFAPNAKSRERALGAYLRLHGLAASVVAPGGLLCAASCSSHVTEPEFIDSVRDGALRGGRRFELLEVHGAAPDHPVLPEFPEGRYLKFALGRVA